MSGDGIDECDEQIARNSGCRGACDAECGQLIVGEHVGVDVDLQPETKEVDLPECTGGQRSQQMRALVDDIVGDDGRNQPDILPDLFVHV